MKYYRGTIIEKIGYDFYCDIAINIVNKRKELGITQEELAKKAKIKLYRLSNIENVKYRIKLDELESLANVLGITVNNLINAEVESQAGDCLYTVNPNDCGDLELYQKASNKRMAFLKLERSLNKKGLSLFSNSRTRIIVRLVGTPITDRELEDKLPKFKEDQEIEQ